MTIQPTSAASPNPSPLAAKVSQPTGQVQIALEGKPLFVSSDSIEFLGEEAAHTIGDGARWRHSYPQTWSWPPQEPASVSLASSDGQTMASVDEQSFQDEYQVKPSVVVQESAESVQITALLDNLEGEDKQAWIVAPFAMPAGHSADSPKAMAVFPASSAELEAITDSDPASQRWSEDVANRLLFVNPGAEKGQGEEDKLLLSDRWSLFAREGDANVLLMPETGSNHPEAFQVYASFDNYVELEWAGDPAAAGASSEIKTRFQAIPLSTLKLGPDGTGLTHFGASGEGLREELTEVAQALGLPFGQS